MSPTKFRVRSGGCARLSRSDQPCRAARRDPEEIPRRRVPTDPFPRYGLAQEYKNAGQLAEAREEFETLMRDHPDYTAAYLHAGNVLLALGERDEARGPTNAASRLAVGAATATR